MAGPIYGEGFIDLKPALSAGFGPALTSLLGPIGPKIATALASPITQGVALAIGAGIALVDIGGKFDEAFDTIRTRTGSTGDALAGLEADFREVFATVPVSMGPAADAIADLNARLGITGQPLQDLSTQFLNLSRITGTDLRANIAGVTRVFGDWGIATDDQGRSLDALFRSSQQTGISVDSLAGTLVQFGAPLRQLGFTFDQSAALVGKFEAEGVNTELVLGSLRIALGKMARDGEDAQTTFQRVTEEIANAGSASEANALALELFGARAGPDMAAAIREGRFALGDLFDAVSTGTETINGAAADTDDWRESMTLLGNNLKLVIEPVATAVFNGLGTLLGWIAGLISGVRDAIADPSSGLGQAFRTIGTVFAGVWDIVSGVIEVFQEGWDRFGRYIWNAVQIYFGPILGFIEGVINAVRAVINTVLALIRGDWEGVWQGIKDFVVGIFEGLKTAIEIPFNAIKDTLSGILDGIKEAWDTVWGGLASAAETFLNAVVTAVKAPINALLGLLESLINTALRGLQAAIDAADFLAGPFINFPDNVFTPVRLARLHAGALARDEALAVVQAGEVVTPSATATRLFDFLDRLAGADLDPTPRGSAALFDGATFNLYGTPDELADQVGRRVGLEVRFA